jgi:hypothetical protein
MSCDGLTGFPTASQMEGLATNLPIVWREICAIQQAVLEASSQCQPGGGQMCTVVGGTTPMTFVNGVSSVSVTNGGDGYFQDFPAVVFVPPVGAVPSLIATATVNTNGGNILSFTMLTQGLGYQPIPATLTVNTATGSAADLQPLVNAAGQIVGINIVSGGINYITGDSIIPHRAVLPDIGYVDATFAITAVSITGTILSVIILNPGSGYQPSVAEAHIVSSLDSLAAYPLGGGFIGTVLTGPSGNITGVLVNNTGSGYTVFPPYLVISDPGTGATTSVTLTTPPPPLVPSSIASIAVLTPGTQYTQTAIGTVMNPFTAALPNPPVTPAVVTINVANNTFGTDPHLYWQVWTNTTTNKAIQMQMNTVLSYFVGLGYTIIIQTNPATGSTIQWKICW